MIYPIVAYGDPVLKKVAKEIEKEGEIDVKKLSQDMFDTMEKAQGVGLAAPQIGLSYRIFVVDTTEMEEEGEGLKETFINARIIAEEGEEWSFEEGCLSIPGIREKVKRLDTIKIEYFDKEWGKHLKEFDGLKARVIQHEYDHIEGILFTDHLSPLKKKLLKSRLTKISKGKVEHDYKMKFPAT